MLRCDQIDGRKQGGVLLPASPRMELKRVSIGNMDTALFEIANVTVHIKNNKESFLCCVVYISPKCDAKEYMHLFLTTIEVQSYLEFLKVSGFRYSVSIILYKIQFSLLLGEFCCRQMSHW